MRYYRAPLKLETHGTVNACWTLCPERLSKSSIVYAIGVGEDISFDLSIIEKHGATVHAFDPTPRVVEWLSHQALPSQFHFHDVAVSDQDGSAQFYPPENPKHVSHSLLGKRARTGVGIQVPTKRLATLTKELGHKSIDVLKMDIEGAEYAVIADMIGSELDVRQLLVEFHHRFKNIGLRRTKTSIALLKSHGYELFAISDDGLNFSFLRRLPGDQQ